MFATASNLPLPIPSAGVDDRQAVVGDCPLTQVTLLKRIRRLDDDEAWERFAATYTPVILRYCRRRGLQEADSYDVLQAVFTNVSRWFGEFEYDASRGRFRSWLGVVTGREIQRLRHRTARPGAGTGGGGQDAVLREFDRPVDPLWMDECNAHILQLALQQIAPGFDEAAWRAFQLVWVEELPPVRVAALLRRPVGWVYKAKFRVLQRLKRQVEALSSDIPNLVE